jgi:hypothetical protein
MKKKVVQNQQPEIEDIRPIIDQQIVNTVHGIFESVIKLNALDDLFADLANRLADDLKANSFMEFNIELSDDQKDLLGNVVAIKGKETVNNYLAGLSKDERTKIVYGLVREKTTGIVDAILSSIGQEINRGAIINAQAVVANSKNKDYDEIILRKTKTSGDITVPTSVILISTNCMEVIKVSCQEEKVSGKKNPEGGA